MSELGPRDHALSNRAFRGLIWLLSGGVLTSALRLVNLVILARLLTPAEFGYFSAALVFVGLSAVFAELGFGPAVIQKSKLSTSDKHAAYTLSLLLGGLLTFVSFLSAPIIGRFFGEIVVEDVIKVLSITFLFRGVGALSIALLERQLAFGQLIRIEFFAYAFANFIPTVVLASLGYGVWALAVGYLLEAIAKTSVMVYLNWRDLGISLNGSSVAHLIRFGAGHSLARISNYAANQGDFAIVGKLLGSAALGEYSRAYQIMASPTQLVGQATSRVLFPAFSKIQHDQCRLREHYQRSLSVSAMVCFPTSAFLVVTADDLVAVILGSGWEGVTAPMQILAGVLAFRTGYKMSDALAMACGAVYSRALWQFVYAASVVAGAIAGADYGTAGVAIGVSIAIILNYCVMANLCKKLTRIDFVTLVAVHVPGLLLGIACAAVCLATTHGLTAVGFSPLLIVLATVLAIPLTILFVVRYASQILGKEFAWFVGVISENLHGRSKSVFHKIIEPRQQ